MRHRILTVAVLSLLGGCSMMSARTPAPVEEANVGKPLPPAKPAPAGAEEDTGVEVYAYGAPPVSAIPGPPPVEQATAPRRTTTNRAVETLMEEAEHYRLSADYVAAAASLERALRIEPRNPVLWNRLARIRLEQGQYSRASSLAAKSNALAGNDQELKRNNSEIIARARNAGAGSGRLR